MAKLDRTRAGWRKSTRSGADNACIEVAILVDGQVGIRDSQAPDAGALVVSRAAWRAFVTGVRAGDFTGR